ncbi:MAG TPA: ROK family protein [Arachnia sp.]|nr:ROK family protein [Arachnia sp.]HMT86773.1 ROK family protein [Arachnia sp.]
MQDNRRTSRDIRIQSRLDVLHALLPVETSTRAQIARATGLSVATVATLVSELLAEGVLVEAGLDTPRAGRPTMRLKIDETRGALVSVAVGETRIRAVAFDAAVVERGSALVPLGDAGLSVERVAAAVVEACRQALTGAGFDESSVLGVGIALPGHIHGGGRRDVVEPHRGWNSDELIERVHAVTGFALVADNPLKAIAAAELWFGRGPGAAGMVVVNLGTGVGAGIVVEGKILRGAGNRAGEWGHTLLFFDGRECPCGRRGCVEAYVGEPGIRETLREIAPGHPLAAHDAAGFVAALARACDADPSDAALREVVERTARFLGYALADLVAVVDPELLMLTGCVPWDLGPRILPLITAHLLERAPVGAADTLRVEVSTVRGNAVAIGMGTLAFEAVVGGLESDLVATLPG